MHFFTIPPPAAAAPAFIIFFGFFILHNHSIFCNATSSNFSCIPSERQALLNFKHDLDDPALRLASWVGHDCCNWSGVVCSKVTPHHVHRLLLGDPHYQFYPTLSGEINPSLVDLKHLRHLDLSYSDIGGARIPEFLGSLGSLRYLNLSYTSFNGMIPHQLGNLTNLHSLDLRYVYAENNDGTYRFTYAKNLQWLSQLSSLRYLDMSSIDLDEASDWLEVTNSLPSLEVLRLRDCNLNFIFRPISHVNFSSLSLLDLSYNYLGNNIPPWVSNLRSLTSLYLSGIANGGSIPDGIQNSTFLVHLDLSDNSLNTSMPSWLYSLSHLKVLNLHFNQLTGTISSEIKNMTSIITLDLSGNELQGDLPTSSMAQLCKLKEIDLSYNTWNRSISQILDICSGCLSDSLQVLNIRDGKIYGHLTTKIGQFRSLIDLDLYNNSISGLIPESLRQRVNLQSLDISNNQMEGIISEAHFANTTRLVSFSATGNPLTLKVGQDWVPPFQLESLNMDSCHLGPQFPMWVRSQKTLSYLTLSNTSLADVLPDWIFNFSSELQHLDLSQNQMHGRIPNLTNMGTQENLAIDLSQNHFEGPLPLVSSKVYKLDLSDNLLSGSISQFLCSSPSERMNMAALDLAKNRLSGKLPNCWSKWKNMQVLYLNYNSFGGGIPSSFGSLIFLQSLHLRSNNLSGILSLSVLQNCINLVTLDLSGNKFGGNVPTWLGTSPSMLRFLSAGFNEFHGHIPDELCALNSLQILDLSNNNLSGPIPKCFNNFSIMAIKGYDVPSGINGSYMEAALLLIKGKLVEYNRTLELVNIIDLSGNSLSGHIPLEITNLSNLLSLNLSNNLLDGEIPMRIGDMRELESIDFSMNNLSGEIPQSMSSLSFLSYLNLSYNNLSGKIPTGTQLQSFNSSSFVGNKLCGPPLTPNCSTNGEVTVVEKNRKEDDHEMSWFYIGMAVGFIVGFWGFCGSLIFNRTWRHSYFRFLDCIKDQIYVASILKLRWFRETITSCYNNQ